MSKNKLIKIICITLLLALIVAAIAFFIIDIVQNGTPPKENAFKMLAAVFICLGGLARIFSPGAKSGRGLRFYEIQYQKEIRNAFFDAPSCKRRLLTALKLYNENKLDKAAKMLIDLRPSCKTKDDFHVVDLFVALCMTDMGFYEEAAHTYNKMIENNLATSTVYGNLGSLYSKMGNYDDAIRAFRLSMQNDEKNPYPYNNLAKLYFDTFDFENAKIYAKKALELNHKFRQPATLLAIVYSLENDKENAEKYSHIAISSGETPERLKTALEHYKAMRSEEKED